MKVWTHPDEDAPVSDGFESADAGARDERPDFSLEIGEPFRIATAERASAIVRWLDGVIAQIDAQIAEYRLRIEAGRESPSSEDWLRRALYARSMRRQHLRRVEMRSRELRAVDQRTVGERLAGAMGGREARLLAEAEAAKLKRAAEAAAARVKFEALINERSSAKMFRSVAWEKLPNETFVALLEEARRRIEAKS
jgi:hypothetical protein